MLSRPPYGSDARSEQLRLGLYYDDIHVEQDVLLRVLARTPEAEDAAQMFDACRQWLTSVIAGQNEGLQAVTGDLYLPSSDPEGLISITWNTDGCEAVDADGHVDLFAVEPGELLTLTAVLRLEEYMRDCTFTFCIGRPSREDYSRCLQDMALRLAEEVSENASGAAVALPSEREGVRLFWAPAKASPPFIIPAVGILVLYWLRASDGDAEKRRRKKDAEAFAREIPSMVLQLILFLDAGLVVSSAFDALIEQNRGTENPLYRAMEQVKERSRASNLSFVRQLYLYARGCGNRDFMRIATLVLDHESSGSDLCEKLEREREQLWNGRLTAAGARAKEAETKLCLPLMLLLLVLVIICIVPALITMQ